MAFTAGCIFFLLCNSAIAQLSVTANFKIEDGNYDQSSVLFENVLTGEKQSLNGSSKLNMNLKYNSIYIFSFSKPGFITKKVEINTHAPAERIAQGFYPINFNVTIMKQYDGVNIVVFNQPVSKWQYDAFTDDFFYDTDYTKSIQSAITDAEKELQKKKEDEKKNAAQAKKDAERAKADSIAQARTDAKAKADSLELARKEAVAKAEEERKAAKAKAEEEARMTAQQRAEEEERRKQQAKQEAEQRAQDAARAKAEEEERLSRKAKEESEARAKSAANAKEEEEAKRLAKLKAEEEKREQLKAALAGGADKREKEYSGDFPVNVTVEEITEPNRNITKATVRKGDLTFIYTKVVYNWGGVYYFKDNISISENLFKMDTGLK